MARGGLTEQDARDRIAAQMPVAEKARRASAVIDTSGTFGETDRQIEAVMKQLSERTPARPPQ